MIRIISRRILNLEDMEILAKEKTEETVKIGFDENANGNPIVV